MIGARELAAADRAPDDAGDLAIQRKLDRLPIITDSIVTVCQLAEVEFQDSIHGLVSRLAAEYAQALERDFQPAGEALFRIAQSWYEVKIVDDARDGACLCVSILPMGQYEQLLSGDLALEGYGRYSRTRLAIPVALAPVFDAIGDAIQALYASGYQWLEANVLGRLTSVKNHMINKLYITVRATLGEDAQHVALFALDKREAFFLLDPLQVKAAFDRTCTQRSQLNPSPIETTSLFVTQHLDADLTTSRASIDEGRPLPENLCESLYAHTRLNLAEIIFYTTPSVVAHPLVREGKLRLVAGYPTFMADEIAPKLDLVAPRLEETVRSTRFGIRRTLRERGASLQGALVHEASDVSRGITGEVIARLIEHQMNLPK